MTTTTLKVKGMACDHCVMAVRKALEGIEGVLRVQVDLKNAQATMDHEGALEMNLVKQALEQAGYELG